MEDIIRISKIRYLETMPLLTQLLNEAVPYAVIKGEPLSMAAYGKLGQRNSADIDILVPRKYISNVKDALFSVGFEPQNSNRLHQIIALSFTHQTVSYGKKAEEIDIDLDLNYDIFWGEYPGKRIDIEEFLADSIDMTIYDFRIKTLPPLKAMVQLVLHHYNEFNSLYHLAMDYCFKKTMFKDIYYLWKNNQEVISLDFYEICYAFGIIPYAYYVLYYTNEIFNDPSLNWLVKTFETPEGKELLYCYGLTEKERKTWKVEFFERLDRKNVFELVKADLTAEDLEKLKRAQEIFG